MIERILNRERIRLRPIEKRDIAFVIELLLDPEVLKWTFNSDPVDKKMKKEIKREIKNLVGKDKRREVVYY